MKNPCVDSVYNWINTPEPRTTATLPEIVYYINSDKKDITGIPGLFTMDHSSCGLLDLGIIEDATSEPISFLNDIISVFTADLSLAGTTQSIIITP